MQDKLMQEFIEAEQQYKAAEARREAVRSQLATLMVNENTQKVDHPVFGVFTVAHKITYSFSKKVKKLEEAVKIQKDIEIKKGKAEVKSDTAYIRYTAPIPE